MTKIAWVEKGGDKNSLAERKGGDKEKKLQQFHLLTLHKYLSRKERRKKIVRWLLNKYLWQLSRDDEKNYKEFFILFFMSGESALDLN